MFQLLIALLLIGISAGCTTSGMLRTDFQNDCAIASGQQSGVDRAPLVEVAQCKAAGTVRVGGTSGPRYAISYVEIDDQGILYDRRQADSALRAIQTTGASDRRLLTIVFVHGWKHSAEAGDANVERFHQGLAALSRWHPEADVHGVYVAWRGKSLTIPYVDNATFWDRKNTSDEVGRGGLLEFLMRLEYVVKGDSKARNRLVLIGHSFGSSVTFNALSGLFMTRFIEGIYDRRRQQRFRAYGDLVVLVNPAIEGMRYMPFHSAIEHYRAEYEAKRFPAADFTHESKPILLILSSEGDQATRKLFPAARFFSTFLEVHRRASVNGSSEDGQYSEWNMDVQALGSIDEFQTHELLRWKGHSEEDGPSSCVPLPKGDLHGVVRDGTAKEFVFPSSQIVLRRAASPGGDQKPFSPFWAMDVSKDVIPDHTSITNLQLLCWFNEIVESE